MKRIVSVLSVAAALAGQAEAACVPPVEGKALMQVLAPAAIAGLGERCADAADFSFASGMAARLRPASDAAFPIARGAFAKLGGQTLPTELSDAALRPVVDAAARAIVVDKIKAADCQAAAMVLRPLATLSPDAFGEVLVGLVMLAPRGGGGLEICR